MRGYRTLIFAAIMAVAGVFGHHLAPDLVNSYLDAIFAVAAVGVAVMRYLTTTPLGLSAHPAVADLANFLTAITAKGDAPIPAVDPPQAADAPASGGATVTGPPPDLVGLAQSIATALSTIQSVHSQMAASLQAANDQVAAAMPVAAPKSLVEVTQSATGLTDPATQIPQPVAAAAG